MTRGPHLALLSMSLGLMLAGGAGSTQARSLDNVQWSFHDYGGIDHKVAPGANGVIVLPPGTVGLTFADYIRANDLDKPSAGNQQVMRIFCAVPYKKLSTEPPDAPGSLRFNDCAKLQAFTGNAICNGDTYCTVAPKNRDTDTPTEPGTYRFRLAAQTMDVDASTGTPTQYRYFVQEFQLTIEPAGGADLSVKVKGPKQVPLKRPTTFDVVVHNAGPAAAKDVVVKLDIPTSQTIKRITPSGGCPWSLTHGADTCRFATISAGKSETVRVRVVPKFRETTAIGAVASSATKDPQSKNDEGRLEYEVQGGDADLAVRLDGVGVYGDSVHGWVEVWNNGPEPAEADVDVKLLRPTEAELFFAVDGGALCPHGRGVKSLETKEGARYGVTCKLAKLRANGQAGGVRFRFEMGPKPWVHNVGEVFVSVSAHTVENHDPHLDNNHDKSAVLRLKG